jgi:hypothetical protein
MSAAAAEVCVTVGADRCEPGGWAVARCRPRTAQSGKGGRLVPVIR